MADNKEGSAPIADEVVGVIVEVTVDPDYSVCIFDQGEVQVLGPPVGRVTDVTGRTIFMTGARRRRIDGMPTTSKDAENSFAYLSHVLNDSRWSSQGEALFGTKVPEGITLMRTAYEAGRPWEVFKIAKDKLAKPSSSRSQITTDLYDWLSNIWDGLQSLAYASTELVTDMKALYRWWDQDAWREKAQTR